MSTPHDLTDRPVDLRPDGEGTTAVVTPPAAPPDRPSKRRFTRRTKIGLLLILLLTLSEVAALGGRYYSTDRLWVIVDNAQVDGDQVEINAPASGVLVDWRVDVGTPVVPRQLLGFMEMQDGPGRPKMPIRSPGRGTVAYTSATEGEYIRSGALLAVAYGDGGVYVTARVPEDEVHEVHPGAPVDIIVDAAPDTPLSGRVQQLGGASAGASELENDPNGDPTDLKQPVYPGADTDPQNPQRVEQYIPVRIEFTDTSTVAVRPGMNVTVHIHKQG